MDTTVTSGGVMTILPGGKVTGQTTIESGAVVSASSGAVVEFYLANLAPSNTALVNDLSLIQGAPDYTITVSGTNACGSYNLADGAPANYSGSMDLYRGSDSIGTLSVGGTVSSAYKLYSLKETGNTLSLDIAEKPIKTDIDHSRKSEVIFYGSTSGTVGYWMNGSDTWRGESGTLPSNQSIVGGYDMNSDGYADLVTCATTVSSGYTMVEIGFYSSGTVGPGGTTYTPIGALNVTSGYEIGIGNLTGNAGKNSVAFHFQENNTVGVWTDGTNSWTGINGVFSSQWKLIGCGDFDGDGKDSVLMSYNNGEALYIADIGGTPAALGLANWSGWDICAIGDFAGDGRDDIVLFNAGISTAVMIDDGNTDSYRILGTLNYDNWRICGAGDYNGDGRDDLLLTGSGLLSYYSGGDFNQWNPIGSGIGSEWTVIA